MDKRAHVNFVETLRLVGGKLCLDFANTIDARSGAYPHECLNSVADLLIWSRHSGLFQEEQIQHLLQDAHALPTEATARYEQALALREAIYRIFSASARGMRPAVDDLAYLSTTYATVLMHAHIVPAAGGFAWAWGDEERWFDYLLWLLTKSAVELLTSQDMHQVKECPGSKGCGWLFLDTSTEHNTCSWPRLVPVPTSPSGRGSSLPLQTSFKRHAKRVDGISDKRPDH